MCSSILLGHQIYSGTCKCAYYIDASGAAVRYEAAYIVVFGHIYINTFSRISI
jgi:hypothetical protein